MREILIVAMILGTMAIATAQSSTRGLPQALPGSVLTPQQGSSSRSLSPAPYQGSSSQGSSSRSAITYPRMQDQGISGSNTRYRIPAISNTPAPRSLPTVAAQTFEQKFWSYLVRAKYRNWAPVPGQSDAMYEGQSPHGSHLKMYLNRTAAGSSQSLRDGSIIIKENYGADQKTLMAITAMYKTNGYNPDAGDWYWVKYNVDGSVANKSTDSGVKRLAGRAQGCIDCHGGAAGGDFVFFND